MNSQKNGSLDSFDKESFTAAFENAVPKMIAELSDLFERRPPRVSRRDRREMAEEVAWGMEVSIPHLKTLEEIGGDLRQVDKAYCIVEGVIRTFLRRTKARLKPSEDAFDYALRKYWAGLHPPYFVKRLRQYRIAREGIERLINAVLGRPGGTDAARQLIEEFNRKHLKEYIRCANALDGRLNLYSHLNLKRMTSQNVTRLTEVYRDAAAAFEKRLRLLVGLNYIACGEAKTYSELRGRGYNELLQAVNSPSYPLLHFLQGAVDRNVRNAVMHAGVSLSSSKEVIRFADYSPRKSKETEIEWTMSAFFRRTRNLILTIKAVAYLEDVFNYAHAYNTFAVIRYLRSHPPTGSSNGSDTSSTLSKETSITP